MGIQSVSLAPCRYEILDELLVEEMTPVFPLQKMQFFLCSKTAFLASITRIPIATACEGGSGGELSIIRIAVSHSLES